MRTRVASIVSTLPPSTAFGSAYKSPLEAHASTGMATIRPNHMWKRYMNRRIASLFRCRTVGNGLVDQFFDHLLQSCTFEIARSDADETNGATPTNQKGSRDARDRIVPVVVLLIRNREAVAQAKSFFKVPQVSQLLRPRQWFTFGVSVE